MRGGGGRGRGREGEREGGVGGINMGWGGESWRGEGGLRESEEGGRGGGHAEDHQTRLSRRQVLAGCCRSFAS